MDWAKMSMGLGVFDGPDHGVGWVLVLVQLTQDPFGFSNSKSQGPFM